MSVHHWIEQVHWLVQVDHSSSDLQHQPCTSTWMWASVVYVIVRCINQKHVKCVGVIYLSYVSSLSTDTPTIRLDSLMQCLGCTPPPPRSCPTASPGVNTVFPCRLHTRQPKKTSPLFCAVDARMVCLSATWFLCSRWRSPCTRWLRGWTRPSPLISSL